MSWRYALGAILTLSALEVVLSSPAAAGRAAGALGGLGTATQYLLSPAYPLIPDRRVGQGGGETQSVPEPVPTPAL